MMMLIVLVIAGGGDVSRFRIRRLSAYESNLTLFSSVAVLPHKSSIRIIYKHWLVMRKNNKHFSHSSRIIVFWVFCRVRVGLSSFFLTKWVVSASVRWFLLDESNRWRGFFFLCFLLLLLPLWLWSSTTSGMPSKRMLLWVSWVEFERRESKDWDDGTNISSSVGTTLILCSMLIRGRCGGGCPQCFTIQGWLMASRAVGRCEGSTCRSDLQKSMACGSRLLHLLES